MIVYINHNQISIFGFGLAQLYSAWVTYVRDQNKKMTFICLYKLYQNTIYMISEHYIALWFATGNGQKV